MVTMSTCVSIGEGERERESTEGREDIVAGAKAASVAASKWIVGGVRRIVRERERETVRGEEARVRK